MLKRQELQSFKNHIEHLPSTWQTLRKGDVLYTQWDQVMNRISLIEKWILQEFSETDVSDEKTKKIIYNILTVNDIIGISLFKSEWITFDKTVSVLWKQDSVIIRHIDKDIFMKEIQRNKELGIFIRRYIWDQLHELENKHERLIFETAGTRIYNALVTLIDLFWRDVWHEVVIDIPLTYEDIGDFSQTGRQTVTTLINDLKREGLIYSKKRWRLLFRDVEEIRNRAKRS